MDKLIGRHISHYKIIEKIGQGSMGVVYKALDTKLKREVALKFLPPYLTMDEEANERFMHEAQAASTLDHQNICNIHDIEKTEYGQLYVVMAYYEGSVLRNKIDQESLNIDEILAVAIQVAEGLRIAHDNNIIHRDIKPSNIFITKDGTAKIIDFGLAKLIGHTKLTRIKMQVGTVTYMSPEQTRGEAIDKRTDIWSLGVILYEMLAGSPPFRGEYEQAIIYSILSEEPQSLRVCDRKIPDEIIGIIKRCLQKDRDKRYQNIADLENDLKKCRQNRKSGKEFVKKARDVHSFLPVIVAGVILLTMIFIIFTTDNLFHFKRLPNKIHLAILPPKLVGGESEDYILCEGLIETMTSKLGQLEDFQSALWIVPASEVRDRELKSANDARDIFGVNLAITISIQHIEDKFRLALNLIDTKSLRQLSSEVLDVWEQNIYQLQDLCVDKLVKMLNVELKPKSRNLLYAGNTGVSTAYESYLKGRGYLQHYDILENIDQAIYFFKHSIDNDSNYTLAYAGLGEAYWKKYEFTRDIKWVTFAKEHAARALEINPDLPEVQITQGWINRGTGNYSGALQNFQKILAIYPKHLEAYQGLAKTYESLGQFEDAELIYKKLIKLRSDSWMVYHDLGVFYYYQGKYENAAEQFEKIIKLAPNNNRAHNNLGACYFELKRWEDAHEIFSRSLSIRPSYRAYNNLGTLYFYEGKYENAADMFENALQIMDSDYRVWGHLAACYFWISGKEDKALLIYKKAIAKAQEALTVYHQDPKILANLAAYYATINKREEAQNILVRIKALKEYEIEVTYRIGEVHTILGERESGLYWLKQALKQGYSIENIRHNPWLKNLLTEKESEKRLLDNIK